MGEIKPEPFCGIRKRLVRQYVVGFLSTAYPRMVNYSKRNMRHWLNCVPVWVHPISGTNKCE